MQDLRRNFVDTQIRSTEIGIRTGISKECTLSSGNTHDMRAGSKRPRYTAHAGGINAIFRQSLNIKVRIAHELPTPEPTSAPIVTPPKPVYEQMPTSDGLPEYVSTLQNVLDTASKVLMVLGGICLALLLIGVVRRIQANVKSAKAQDHLERGTYRDYTQPAPKGRKEKKSAKEQPVSRPIGEDKGGPAIPDADASAEYAEDGELMAETLRKLYPNENRSDAAVTVEVEGENAAEESVRGRRSQRHQE